MGTLIVGASVIGSFKAAGLTEAGQDVTQRARESRLADLHRCGVVLEDFRTGRHTITQVPLYLKDEVRATYLADVVKARHMQCNETYLRDPERAKNGAIIRQQCLIDSAVARTES